MATKPITSKPMTATAPREPGGFAGAEMASTYRPAEIEPEIYARWLEADVFPPDGRGVSSDPRKGPFVIVQPPPNVTGALHIGHALTATVEDAMIRRARMQGYTTLWQPGVDHASIAAQVVLDRVLAMEGESRESLGRERYLERMWRFVEETRGVISGQHRRLGASADWARERFTMDPVSARAVRTAFKQLHDDGLAYRGERLINWCPGDLTSVSDLEVIATPEKGTLWFVRYHLLRDDGTPDPDETITVATTRPETILGDTAVAVHPEDDRYRSIVGRRALIPFVKRAVPVITDPIVERDFGSGAVKITPAHDQDDFETGRRHGLPIVDVMTDDGHINDAGGPYAGLTLEEARKRIVADLETDGDLVEARPHEMILGRCQRSHHVIEPRIKVQWFINVKPMAERATAAVREGRTRIVPQRFEKVFFDWMENIRDWNVSRQLWWGHRIPAWYCPDGHVTVSDREDGPERCAACGRPATELQQDPDIFDTWFSSGLWPFSTLGWPDATLDFQRFYPGTVMETGYDIIFFWVARMMMLGEWLTGREPFRIVYLHGMLRDPMGAKMSKTTGNVVDPLGVIEEVGADSLRFALINGSAPGADQRLGPSRLDGARNFANKVWNASRFVLGSRPVEMPSDAVLDLPPGSQLGPAEHWILARAADTIRDVDAAYSAFQFGEAVRILHHAIWSEYCDWYLELAKVQLAPGASPEARTATWQVLAWVLDRYLRLLHPVMPHLTEAIWGRLPHEVGDRELLIVARWPDAATSQPAFDARQAGGVAGLLELITGIRNARADAGIDAAAWLDAALLFNDAGSAQAFEGLAEPVARLARIRPRVVASRVDLETAGTAGALSVVTGPAEARLTTSGGDLAGERARLEKELADTRRQLDSARARLANPQFVAKAPSTVVDGARARVAELEERLVRLGERLG
jgi:valyl-tRNA synthetase